MNIAELCQRQVVVVDADASLRDAATLMREHHVGSLVVTTRTNEGLRVKGIVTDRDLVIDVLARGLSADEVRIGALAHERLVCVADSVESAVAVAAMQNSGVRRLLVTDADQQLTGIVSLDDLVAGYAQELAGLARVIHGGIEREKKSHKPPPPVPPLRIPAVGTAGWHEVAR